MRITNGMMTNNSLMNINANKDYLDRLNGQMATEKKLTRPSDDPVVAIRALRLHGALSEVTQYYGQNVPDAVSWVDVTQKSIESTVDILSSMRALCDQGANGTNDVSDRTKIYEGLKGNMQQIYQNGNVSYAGRTVFTGFRTEKSLTFTEKTVADYHNIVDTFNPADLQMASYIEGGLTNEQIDSMTATGDEELKVKEDRVNRIRLSYDNLEVKTKIQEVTDTVSNAEFFTENTKDSAGLKLVTNDGRRIEISTGGTVKIVPSEGASFSGEVGVGHKILIGNTEITVTTDLSSITVTRTVTVETGDAKVTYRENPENEIKTEIPDKVNESAYVERRNPDPITGKVYGFQILDGTETITIEYDFDESSPTYGKYISSDPHVKSPVHQNTDGTFKVVVTDQPYDDPPASSAEKVYNISANGRVVNSAYKESTIEAVATSSTSAIGQNAAGDYITAYQKVALDPNDRNVTDTGAANKVYLLKDTGELVFGSNVADKFRGLKTVAGTDLITVTYDKREFETGDPRPEHYFDCKLSEEGREIRFEADGVTEMADSDPIIFDDHRQKMIITVGSNQDIQINTSAEDVFAAQIAREVDDILEAINTFNTAQDKVDRLKSHGASEDPEKIRVLTEAANKELDIARNKLQAAYEKGITAFGNFHDSANLAATTCGTVDNRLTLISNRLLEEKTTVRTLTSENEDVDITQVAVDAKEAELMYNAALMSTGKIGQHTLMDYI